MIHTVLGAIKKEEMGITLSHEHFKWENDECYANEMYYDQRYNEEDIKKSTEIILPILNKLYEHSCRTIVEATPPFGGQNIKLLKDLSEKSKINIIPSTGWNISKYTYDVFSENFAHQLANRWVSDFENGLDTIDGIIIKPGYIKLLLDEGELKDVDKEMLKAAVITSKKTNLPIHCHIFEANMVYDVIDLLEKEEADLSKFLWAHSDFQGQLESINYALRKGIWVGFDIIRIEHHDRVIKLLKEMIKSSQTDKIILSQDYEFYTQYNRNKAHVCYSIFTDFIPLCKTNGIPEALLIKMLTENPANYYDI